MALPQGPNQRWSLDFLSDTLADGRRFRILAIVDDFHPGMPGAGGRYLTARIVGRARARCPDRLARPSRASRRIANVIQR